MAEPDSSKLTSAQLKQQLKEQTRGLKEAPEEVEAPAEEFEVQPEPTEEKVIEETEVTPEEIPPTEQPPEPVEKPTLHKLKVEGKEEEVTQEKLIEYAQKGRHYEKEMAKLKREREELRAQRTSEKPPVAQPSTGIQDPEKAKEMFLQQFADNPIGTLLQMNQLMQQQQAGQTAEEKKAERLFDLDQQESNPVWNQIKPRYQEFRDLGHSREMAATLAENDLLRTAILNAQTAGIKKGQEKEKAKQKAEIPVGGKGTKPTDIGLSDEAIGKLKASDLKRKLPRVRTPGY